MGCLGENTIAGLVDGMLSPDARAKVSDHLARCAECRDLVATLAPPARSTPSSGVSRPNRARTQQSLHNGRYVLEHVLGEGGMGVVYRAYDAQLRRSIALKVVRPDRLHAESAARMRERFLREAQAMAQLNHPHVVTVYDVGIDDDQVFVAMELVEGQTLRTWHEHPHTLAEIGRVLDQAGRGLAAAHDAGLVHRDFKPDNVLVRVDGRVQVSDFGLARRYDGADASAEELLPTAGGPITGTLTATGGAAGTPAYMAPEQWKGGASAASDQYSFSQVAWELVYGTRPHADAADVRDLARRIATDELTAPNGREVPSAVEAVLRRGLSREPGERFPDMRALLSALDEAIGGGARRSPRRRTIWIAVGAIVVASAVGGLLMIDRSPPPLVEATPSAQAASPAPPPVAPPLVAPAPVTAPPPIETQASDAPPPRGSPVRRKERKKTEQPARPSPTAVDRTDAVISDPWKHP